jgi:hypothetical protein
MNNAGEKPHLIQTRFSDRFTSDTAALPTKQRAPLLIPNCCCDAIDHNERLGVGSESLRQAGGR